MVSMKLFIASTAAVAKAANVDHVLTSASLAETPLEHHEVEMTLSVDDGYFTPRGFYGSSRVEEPEFERKEVDCALLKGNQTLPAECSVFANATQSHTIATNSTVVDECDSLTGMARIECLGMKPLNAIDCSKFKGNRTMPFECSKQLGMVDEESTPETIILQEAQPGDELTWEQAFQTMFPDLIKTEEAIASESCFSCDILSTLLPADSMFGRLATKAADLVKSVFDEPELTVDDALDCSMQLGNKTMTAECSEALDSEFVYYRGESTNSTIAQEPRISPLGFIVEEIDCEALALKGQTLPWQCMNQKNTTQSSSMFGGFF